MSVSRCLSLSSLFAFSLAVLLPAAALAESPMPMRAAPRMDVETVPLEGFGDVKVVPTSVANAEQNDELTDEETSFNATVPLPGQDSLGQKPQPAELATVAGIPPMAAPVPSMASVAQNIGAVVAGALPADAVSRPIVDTPSSSRRATSVSFRVPELPDFKRSNLQAVGYSTTAQQIAAPVMPDEDGDVADSTPAETARPAAAPKPFAASLSQAIADAANGTNDRLKKLEGTIGSGDSIGDRARDRSAASQAAIDSAAHRDARTDEAKPAAPESHAAPAAVSGGLAATVAAAAAEAQAKAVAPAAAPAKPAQVAAADAKAPGFQSYASTVDLAAAPHLIGALMDDAAPAASSGEPLRVADKAAGTATALDGATLLLAGVEVQLFGVAVPSDAAGFADRARAGLDDLVAGQPVRCDLYAQKGLASAVPGRCATDAHEDVALALLGQGLVTVDRRATLGVDVAEAYDAAEKAARDNKLGLWGTQPAGAKGNGKVDGWQFVFGSLAGVGIISFFLWWGLKGITMTQRDLAQEQRRRERAHLRRDAMSMSAAIRGELVAAKLSCKRYRQQLLDFRRDPKNVSLPARPAVSTRVFDANASRVALLGPTLAENLAELYASFHQDQGSRMLDARGERIDEVCDDSDNHALYLMEQIDMAILDLENYAKLPSVLPLADQAAQRAKLQAPDRAERAASASLTPDLRVVG